MNQHYLSAPVMSVPVLAIFVLGGCSQLGPDDADFKSDLQASIPKHWQVKSVKIESRENTGTNTVPKVETRFKAKTQLEEDTFKKLRNYKIEVPDPRRIESVIFIQPANKAGKNIDIFGIAVSERYNEKWKTFFQIDGDPFDSKSIDFGGFPTDTQVEAVGQELPRSRFQGKTVLINTPEEQVLKNEIAQQIELEEQQILSKLFSESHEGSPSISSFTIKSESKSDEIQKVSGQIEFISFVEKDIRGFEGTMSDTELKFTITKELGGTGGSQLSSGDRLGNTYIFSIKDLALKRRMGSRDITIEGRWTDARPNRGGGDADITIENAVNSN
jgi:hypothetical protein